MKNIPLLCVLLFFAVNCRAQNRELWMASTANLTVSDLADIRSSWRLHELNPILGTGEFGIKQASLSVGITGLGIFSQAYLCRSGCSNKKYLGLTLLNLGISGVHYWLAYRQMGLSRSR